MTIGSIEKFIIHYVGNKNNGDGVRLSEELTEHDKIESHIKSLIEKNFQLVELYKFYFQPSLDLNPMYQFVRSIFNDGNEFIEQSQNAGRYLYDKSVHPQIKQGEFCFIKINDCILNDKKTECIAVVKSENKDTILKVNTKDSGFSLNEESGINTNKLDKGCLIFNQKEDDGYLVAVVDNTNRNSEAQYWKEEFLNVVPINNEFHQTNQFLDIAKKYVTEQITDEFDVDKTDQIDLLNRSVEYFKSNDKFEKADFEREVFQEESLIESFRAFDNSYRSTNEIDISDNFDISNQAVKKKSRAFKRVLKLDKNFHIYVHGDRDLIEKGTEPDGRKFYKIYYNSES